MIILICIYDTSFPVVSICLIYNNIIISLLVGMYFANSYKALFEHVLPGIIYE